MGTWTIIFLWPLLQWLHALRQPPGSEQHPGPAAPGVGLTPRPLSPQPPALISQSRGGRCSSLGIPGGGRKSPAWGTAPLTTFSWFHFHTASDVFSSDTLKSCQQVSSGNSWKGPPLETAWKHNCYLVLCNRPSRAAPGKRHVGVLTPEPQNVAFIGHSVVADVVS